MKKSSSIYDRLDPYRRRRRLGSSKLATEQEEIQDVGERKKRKKELDDDVDADQDDFDRFDAVIEKVLSSVDLPSDSLVAFLDFRRRFPCEAFKKRVPPIVIRHQFYSSLRDRTSCDKELSELQALNCLRLFCIGDAGDFVFVATVDYIDHLIACALGSSVLCADTFCRTVVAYSAKKSLCISDHIENSGGNWTATLERFVAEVLPSHTDVSISKETLLSQFHFTDAEVSYLVQFGVLLLRNANSFWLAIPGAGIFVKNLIKGRQEIIRMIGQAQYHEILVNDLKMRKLRSSKLGMDYHIDDIVGGQLTSSIQTTMGILLRKRT